MGHFKAINTSARLADEVYQQILDAITAGVVDPHKRIVQERLADQLQGSRTPIREALIRLENEGVLVRVGRSVQSWSRPTSPCHRCAPSSA